MTWADLDRMSLDTVLDLNEILDAWNEAGKAPKMPKK